MAQVGRSSAIFTQELIFQVVSSTMLSENDMSQSMRSGRRGRRLHRSGHQKASDIEAASVDIYVQRSAVDAVSGNFRESSGSSAEGWPWLPSESMHTARDPVIGAEFLGEGCGERHAQSKRSPEVNGPISCRTVVTWSDLGDDCILKEKELTGACRSPRLAVCVEGASWSAVQNLPQSMPALPEGSFGPLPDWNNLNIAQRQWIYTPCNDNYCANVEELLRALAPEAYED